MHARQALLEPKTENSYFKRLFLKKLSVIACLWAPQCGESNDVNKDLLENWPQFLDREPFHLEATNQLFSMRLIWQSRAMLSVKLVMAVALQGRKLQCIDETHYDLLCYKNLIINKWSCNWTLLKWGQSIIQDFLQRYFHQRPPNVLEFKMEVYN